MWFEVEKLGSDLYVFTDWMGDYHPRFGRILTHSYLLLGATRAVVVDCGLGIGDLRVAVGEITDLPVELLLTHNHSDHIGSAFAFDHVSIGVGDAEQLERGLGAQDAEYILEYEYRTSRETPSGFSFSELRSDQRWRIRPSRVLSDGDEIDIGQSALRVLTTPGHTPGSCCFLDLERRLVFTGDTLYEGNLNIQLDGSDLAEYRTSIRSLDSIPSGFRLLPGHYLTPISTMIIGDVSDGLRRLGTTPDAVSVGEGWVEADFERFSLTVRSSELERDSPLS
jgi:glyoxylase-like metal-dependent hydrolase (beta-lactamase superfamily II)